MILKGMSWGVEVRWGEEKHPAEVSGSQGRLWRFPNGKLHQSRSWTRASLHPSPSKWRCSTWLSVPACVQKALTTPGALQTVVFFTPSCEVLPVELVWSQGSCAAVTELCSWILSGPAPVHTRHETGYPIVPGTSHVLAGLSSPGLVFCSQIRDAYLNQGRFKLKKKKITLKYNPLLKIILKYYIFQICLLNTKEFKYSGKILVKVSRKPAKLVSPDLSRQESLTESAAESSPVAPLTLRRIAFFCFEIGSPKLGISWGFLWERRANNLCSPVLCHLVFPIPPYRPPAVIPGILQVSWANSLPWYLQANTSKLCKCQKHTLV